MAALQGATGDSSGAAIQPPPSPEPKRVHRQRRRRWYKRLWDSLFPTYLSASDYLVIILVISVLSVLAALFVCGVR